MQRFDLYKSIYDRENSRREVLTSSVNIPIGILTAIFTAFTYFVTSFQNDNLLINVVFYFLIILCFISNVISITFLLKSFNRFHKGHEYKELPFVRVMEDYYIELSNHYKKDKELIDPNFENYLISELVEYTDINMRINDQRSLDLFKAKRFIFFSLLGLALICILYVSLNSNNQISNKAKSKIQQNQIKMNSPAIFDSINYKLNN